MGSPASVSQGQRHEGFTTALAGTPRAETAKRYVGCLDGVDNVMAKGRKCVAAGDLRFAAQLLKHAVFADPDNTAVKKLLADTYERLGFCAESGT